MKCVVPRKRIFIRAGEINKGVTKKNRIVKEFMEKLSFLEGAVGCLTIQIFFHKENEKIGPLGDIFFSLRNACDIAYMRRLAQQNTSNT